MITAATSNGGALKVIPSDCLQSRELLRATGVFYWLPPAFNSNQLLVAVGNVSYVLYTQ